MVIGVIPARIGSTRFPRKILADIEGKPMIAHVAERALESEMLDKVVIAIDSEETEKALASYKFDLIMTDIEHQSGTDRVAEVAKTIEEAEIIINIQGDEPLLSPKVIDKDSFEQIVKVAFSQKRKTIKNNFKNILFDKDFFNLEISPKIRSEALTIDQFIKLENYVTQNNINFDC